MKWITHIIFAILFVKLLELSLLSNLLVDYLSWFVLTLYAILPDFDSFLGIKHRTWTHSLIGLVTTTILLSFSYNLFLVALFSYLSHLFADMLTVSGIPLLYPMEKKFHLLPPQLRIKTSSIQELVILSIVSLISAITFIVPNSAILSVFELSNKFDIYASFSYYENGVNYECKNVKIVWNDGKSKIGIIRSHRLKIIDTRNIEDFSIVSVKKVDRFIDSFRISVKRLKSMDYLIVGYEINGRHYEFLGSGLDLFDKLEGSDVRKITVYVVKSRCLS